MTNPYPYDLALPPRHVPWSVRAQLIFGGGMGVFGWIWLGFSLIFLWIFGLQSDYAAPWFLLDTVETTPGVVTHTEETSASINETRVIANYFTYRVEREETDYEGVSYTTGPQFWPEDRVVVEYIRRAPTVARIENTRWGQFDIWVVFFILIFPLVGFILVGVGIKNGIKANRLLTRGKIGRGTLLSKEATNTRVNNQMVYKLTFEFRADDGQLYQVECRTTNTYVLEDEPEERLLYDPYHPRYAVMLDNLPGSPDIDEFGKIKTRGMAAAVLALLLPALVIIVHGTILLLVVLGNIL